MAAMEGVVPGFDDDALMNVALALSSQEVRKRVTPWWSCLDVVYLQYKYARVCRLLEIIGVKSSVLM